MLTETRPILATMTRRPRAHQGTTKKDQSLDQGRGSEVTGSSSNNPPKPSRSPLSRRDKPKHHEITQATGLAMTDLLRQVVRDGTVGEMRMCRILSRYGVPWQNTRWTIGSLELTEEEVIGRRRGVTITVYSPA